MANAIKVMLVDDSAVLRQVLSNVLNADARLDVIATASDPIVAQQLMAKEWPDVLVLDVEMPRMDGLTFLRQLMAEHPLPVVICSTLTAKGAATTLEALSAGAVAFMTKPTLGLRDFIEEQAAEFRRVVITAASARPRRTAQSAAANQRVAGQATVPGALQTVPGALQTAPGALQATTDRIVAIGASTGGTQALQAVLQGLPRTAPGIVVVQHMPPSFTAMLAQQLDKDCAMNVREAADGDRVHDGVVLIAPGGHHMKVVRDGAHYRVSVLDAPPVNQHRPSVDVLLRSVAQCAGANALGIILTGMGHDGARGLLAMQQAGARTFAQDEESCVVFGMPKEAIALGAADQVRSLMRMAPGIMAFQAQTMR
ncbi:chemotaxis response regulator protein-glutamate methylesterase [soil metagenome]